MKQVSIVDVYKSHPRLEELYSFLADEKKHAQINGVAGSSMSLTLAAMLERTGKQQHMVVLSDKEKAAYFYNDLEYLFEEADQDVNKKKVLFYPTSYKRPYEPENPDRSYQLSRTEVLKRMMTGDRKTIIVTYPEALAEKVITKSYLTKNIIKLKQGEKTEIEFLCDMLVEFGFESVEFVAEPGQFALRGGIVDVFSYSNDHPYRIEFYDDHVESIRTFDPVSQLSVQGMSRISLLPNVQDRTIEEKRVSILEYMQPRSAWWIHDVEFASARIDHELEKAENAFERWSEESKQTQPGTLFISGKEFLRQLMSFTTIEFGGSGHFQADTIVIFKQHPQPSFNKKFDFLITDLTKKAKQGFTNFILSDNPKQTERLHLIFEDIGEAKGLQGQTLFTPLTLSLSEGFYDTESKMLCYTDHQIFDRYYKFHLREGFGRKEALSIKELYDLKPGDYITHIDHGVGCFDGLQVIDNNGRKQEAIRLIYKNNDLLYVSIHSLHRIAKYVGKEGTPPVLNKLGSNAWNKLKAKTKKRVKDIARDLIRLYAKRKAAKGYAFMPDTYLQNELEASFIYEDTPDQMKATRDVKKDMESSFPADRLVCGDVGFGKTEVAIRAAFKAVNDSKQVAVLVPTTILALQHFKTFSERLRDFPVTVDYINRFKSPKKIRETLEKLKEGKIDILIGTHRLLSKDIEFHDLGLYVIDEEQKFGVSAKEKLRKARANIDTLTLTATPIPRTLQFSLMGARDLSIINTPPPNRYPVQTELRSFGEEIIREAITYEVSRGGQVFFVHNRVQNIMDVYDMLKRFVPGVRIGVAHGQMDGKKLEQVMIDFIDGEHDVLLATTIIESGLDIPNANTIIINDAHNYGLSDLHQLRGRVGRSNKKAFCYLLSPPLATLTSEARKRLQAISEFAELGSGFNIAMRDLDIRGAGNILGAEQSGFISEVGIEMYQKILDEAMAELKESEFKELFVKEQEEKKFAVECQLETDLELHIPEYYVSTVQERLNLYKELDSMETKEALKEFEKHLEDRFGPLPEETKDLLQAIRLRWLGGIIGFEKLTLKYGNMTGTFAAKNDSPYFQSEMFGKVLQFIQEHPRQAVMKKRNEKLILRYENVITVKTGIEFLLGILNSN